MCCGRRSLIWSKPSARNCGRCMKTPKPFGDWFLTPGSLSKQTLSLPRIVQLHAQSGMTSCKSLKSEPTQVGCYTLRRFPPVVQNPCVICERRKNYGASSVDIGKTCANFMALRFVNYVLWFFNIFGG